MKHYILSGLIILMASFSVHAAEKEIVSVESEVKEVTVFLHGAQVFRRGNKIIEEGTSYLKFINLSPGIEPNSIQVEAKNDVEIVSVVHKNELPQDRTKPLDIRLKEDSVQLLNEKLAVNRKMKEVYQEEKALVLANKSIEYKGTGVFIEDLEDLADFYRNRLTEIMKNMLELEKEDKTLKEKLTQLQNRLNRLRKRWMKSSGEIIVEVNTAKRINAKLNLSYLVENAGWHPTYTIRAEDNESPLNLNYKAKVFQNTGADWKDVRLSLSTGNPTKSGSQPDPQPWQLRYVQPVPVYDQYSKGNYKQKAYAPAQVESESQARSLQESMDAAPMPAQREFKTVESKISTEFKIDIPYTISSDGEEHLVEIKQYELPASYKYYAVPRLDKDAFLLASVTDWDQYNLLSGETSIFYEGTFVGKSYINTRETKDTLHFSLGRDKDVVVTREKVKKYSETKVLGSNKKETIGIEIQVRNKKKSIVELDLIDQIPVSTNKDIEVELIESSKAKYTSKNGFLKWQVELKPSESKKFTLIYSVKYPKDKIINL